MPQVQTNAGKQQREGNRQSDNDRSPSVAKKNEQYDDYQEHSLGEVVEHRMGRVMDQVIAVQVRNDLHARWKNMLIQSPNHGVNGVQRGGGVRALAQKHNSF